MKDNLSEEIYVFVVDNNPIFRAGISSFLKKANSEIRIVGEAEEGEDVLEGIKDTSPHIVLLDSSLINHDSEWNLLCQICAGEDAPNVIVMAVEDDFAQIIQVLFNGAVGVVTKDVSAAELRQLVAQAAQGCRALSSTIVHVLVNHLLQRESSPLNCHPAVIESLTEREVEVYSLVAQGLSNKEIAERLSLCLGTVKSHVSNILAKVQVNNRAQLALIATGQFSLEMAQMKYETSLT